MRRARRAAALARAGVRKSEATCPCRERRREARAQRCQLAKDEFPNLASKTVVKIRGGEAEDVAARSTLEAWLEEQRSQEVERAAQNAIRELGLPAVPEAVSLCRLDIDKELGAFKLVGSDVAKSIEDLKEGIQIPVIFACRSSEEGGHFYGAEDVRVSILQAAIDSGVTWIDLEIAIDKKARKALMDSCGDVTSVVASSHLNPASSADEIVDFVNDNSSAGNIIKCCYMDVVHSNSLFIFEAAERLADSEVQVALMGHGPGGDWTRIHAPMLKQALVYTTLDRDYGLVKRGQVNINDLRIAWGVLEYE